MPMEQLLFEHCRGTRREGLTVLIITVMTLVLGFGLMTFVYSQSRTPRDAVYYITLAGGLGIGALCVFGYALPNLCIRRQFRFAIYRDRVVSESPHPSFATSFEVPLTDIVAIEIMHEKPGGEYGNSTWYYLLIADGRRLEVTSNYDNPRDDIVRVIKTIRPDIAERHI